MKGDTHPVDVLLRAAVGEPLPTTDDVLAGRRMLLAAMRAEQERAATPSVATSRPRRGFAVASVTALVLAVVVGASLLTPTPVTALGDLAVVAERLPAVPLGDEAYVYTKTAETSIQYHPAEALGLPTTGTVAYLLPIVRERWEGSDGIADESVRIGEPRFFDPAHKRAYNQSGLRESDGVGTLDEGGFSSVPNLLDERDWSTDPVELLEQMRVTASSQAGSDPEDAAIVSVAKNLLVDPATEPGLRSSLLQALAILDPGEIVRSPNGEVVLSVEFIDAADVPTRIEIEFDRNSNVREFRRIQPQGDPVSGVPPGTAVEQTTWQVRRAVGGVGQAD